jgi:hypothetical protein
MNLDPLRFDLGDRAAPNQQGPCLKAVEKERPTLGKYDRRALKVFRNAQFVCGHLPILYAE